MAKTKTVKLDKDIMSLNIVTPDGTIMLFRIADFLGTQVCVYTDTDSNPELYFVIKDERVSVEADFSTKPLITNNVTNVVNSG